MRKLWEHPYKPACRCTRCILVRVTVESPRLKTLALKIEVAA